MSTVTDWLTALSSITVAGSIIYVARQAKAAVQQAVAAVQQATAAAESVEEARKERADDHLRSRREGAVMLLLKWTESISNAETCAMHLVNSLDAPTARDFKRCAPLKVSDKQKRNLEEALAGTNLVIPAVENNTIAMDVKAILHVGRLCMNYLGVLEVILIGWRYGTADREILEEQLSFLVKPDEGMLLAENFRVAMGIQNYPNIEQFVQEIKAKKNSVPPKKNPLGV